MNRMMIRACAVVLLTVALGRSAIAAEPAQRFPTPQELVQMYDAKQYQICLQQIARVLALRGDLAKPYDKHALLLLRGDCLLNLEDTADASRAYKQAMESADVKVSQAARASMMLIRKSGGLAYRPKTSKPAEPPVITNDAGRKQAMIALLADELAEETPRITRAKASKTLPPILDIVEPLMDMAALEATATGKMEQVEPILAGLGQHTRDLMEADLKIQREKVATIESRANQQISNSGPYWWQSGSGRRGLYTPDRKELRALVEYVEKVGKAAELGRQYAWKLGKDGAKWEPVLSDCVEIIQKAERVIEAG